MPVERDRLAAALPGYALGAELGSGAWGTVVAATDRASGRAVVVKQLEPSLTAEPAVRARFQATAPLLSSLGHGQIVATLDHAEREALCVLVTERVEGGSLRSSRSAGDRGAASLSPQTACALVAAAAGAVAHAHARGVLHRDIHPGNLLITAEGAVKVSDFGLAEIVGGDQTVATRAGQVLGAPPYMAPEQALGQRPTAATDVYSLASVLYELLAGRLPFTGAGDDLALFAMRVQEDPAPLGQVAPSVPAAVAAVVMRGLARDPLERGDADGFGASLAEAAAQAWGTGRQAASGVPLTTPPSAAVEPPPPPAETLAPPSEAPTMTAAAVPPAPPPPAPPVPAAGQTPPAPARPAAARRSTGLWAALAVAAIVVAAVLVVLLTRGGGSKHPVVIGPTSISVPGDRPWTPTGVVLRAGDQVAISATGTVNPNTHDNALVVGPVGAVNRPDILRFNVFKDADHAALLGRIDDGDVFFVGADKRFTAAKPGALALGINDVGLDNNSGAFQARVTVTRR